MNYSEGIMEDSQLSWETILGIVKDWNAKGCLNDVYPIIVENEVSDCKSSEDDELIYLNFD